MPRNNLITILLPILAASSSFAQSLPNYSQNIINTVAGRDWVFTSRNISAVNAPLSTITSLALDASGLLYVADPQNNAIFRIDGSGNLTTFAGNGIPGFSGEGGPATSASLYFPTGIAFDSAGNLYVTDQGNQRIRMVTTSGNIVTIAGTGVAGYSGDGGPAVNAQISTPGGIQVDPSGNIFFVDSGNNRVREITAGGTISTVAATITGNPSTLNSPKDLALDSQGNLYISDYGNNRILKLSAGTLSVYAGRPGYPPGNVGDNGPATLAQLRNPWGLVIDASGNLDFTDSGNNTIRQISPAGVITTIAGNGTAQWLDSATPTTSSFFVPAGLLNGPGGKLYVADRGNQRVRSFNLGGAVSTVAGNDLYRVVSTTSSPTSTYLYGPQGIAIGTIAGDLLIAESRGNAIRDISITNVVAKEAGLSLVGGYTANGATGANTLLNSPYGVAKGSDGTIYYADTANSVVRAISPIDGTVTTIAGTAGVTGYNSGIVPANTALLNQPRAVLVDSSNNIYISDTGNSSIQKITGYAAAQNGMPATPGSMQSIAGTGTAGFSGDGALATAAQINAPYGLAFYGNSLYFADQGNHRIRMIAPNGNIMTVAGTGSAAAPGPDGGQALATNIPSPFGIAFDSGGNLYYSENQYHTVRSISKAGVVTTIAGTSGVPGFEGDGGLAPEALLSFPAGIAVNPINNYLYIADSGNDRVRAVIPIQPSFAVSSTNLTLSASGGLVNNPQELLSITALLSGMQITGLGYTIVPNSNSSWLTITPTSGTLPQQILVSANAASLSPGSITGSFTIMAPGASTAPITVNVAVNVGPTLPPTLTAVTTQLSQSVSQGASTQSSNISLANNGSGTINYTATVQTVNGGSWLTLPSPTGSVSNASPAALVVNTNPGSLAPGVYRGSVTVTGTSQVGSVTPITVPISLTVTQSNQVIQLTQTALNFRAVTTGSSPLPRTFGIVNTGQGSLSWTATVVDANGNAVPWLTVSPSSGTVSTANTAASLVSVTASPLNMTPGDYYAKIQISGTAANSPQTVTVLMTVLGSTTATFADLQPSALVFTAPAGSVPSSQIVNIAAVGAANGAALSYVASAVTLNGTAWFADLPRANTIAVGTPDRIVVQPNFTALTAGTYTGSISLLFGDGSTRTIKILSVVTASATSSAVPGERVLIPAASCSSSKLDVQFSPPLLQGSNSFTAYAGQQNTLTAAVVYDCTGASFTSQNGQVTAFFKDGEPSQPLTYNSSSGMWSTVWSPTAAANSTVAVQLTATGFSGANPVAGTSDTFVATLSPGATVPLVAAGGVVSAASFQADVPIGVGGLITVFGNQLVSGSAGQAANVPLPNTIGGTQVLLENVPVPILYASNGQINVQVPYNTDVNVPQHLVVQRGTAISAAFPVQVASVQPAIFVANTAGQGIIVNSTTNVLAAPGTPVTAGQYVTIYCTGLGPTNPVVATGSAATGAAYITTGGIAATIGGQNATLVYAGLTPGFPGLYQVNALVPSGVTGNAVPVVMTLAGQVSPTVTMAIQ
jgi:uncharacterized protein (TIGR03437 family)